MKVSSVVAMSLFALGIGGGQVWAAGQEAQAALPEGAVLAWVNVPRIAAESASGQELAAQVQALNEEKLTELNTMNEALQASQQKLQQGGTVMSDTARAQLEREIGRMQVDIQRATEDAQIEVQTLQEQLQVSFQDDLIPVIAEVSAEKGLHLVLSVSDSGVVWSAPGLDITDDVITRFDAAHAAAGGAAQPQP
ncbi:MAG: OmpH family outer membrane protein [Vicinamibacterales bacterium]|mgnify:FL=1|jgi:Skp family chaperone for outer membrane proteins|nr:hypothetical protein [Acidobacteriota bacterium]MDP6371482.1 OmpH family outer membrane protein [Vicinamibacterales bacterium]MDP6609393.1 OmpH family outer membrane protein [Vicinamibacterales bacterium]|tara:strand:+ start:2783 stop:3364 length:582 start_codon:yes stop_codon:yes gene_type:complete